MRSFLFASLGVLVLLGPSSLYGDDGAASVGAGGLVLMKREPRITMAKEVLHIAVDQVVVDYDFRNDSDSAITTVVAFPVPAYTFGESETVFGDPAFRIFQLSVNGQRTPFQTETRALVGSRDVTAELKKAGIDAATFGHWDTKDPSGDGAPADFQRASQATQRSLRAAGLFDKNNAPQWRVEKKYFWTQTFPARGVVHIRHAYLPVVGGTNSVRYGLQDQAAKEKTDAAAEIASLCLEPPLQAKLLKRSAGENSVVPFNYVDFILTTANTWKTPIEDFTLLVDRPAPLGGGKGAQPSRKTAVVSFCWAGPIEPIGANQFRAHRNNFVPAKELRVGFVYLGSDAL